MNLFDMTPDEIYKSVDASLAWLEANPDKHIRNNYMQGIRNSRNQIIGMKFCALGKIMFDNGFSSVTQVNLFLERIGVKGSQIMCSNDNFCDAARLRRLVDMCYSRAKESAA